MKRMLLMLIVLMGIPITLSALYGGYGRWNGQRPWGHYHNGWDNDGGGAVIYVDTPLYYYNSNPNLNYNNYFYPYPDYPYYHPRYGERYEHRIHNYIAR